MVPKSKEDTARLREMLCVTLRGHHEDTSVSAKGSSQHSQQKVTWFPQDFPFSLVLHLPFYGTNKCLKLGEEKSLDKTKMTLQGHSLMCDKSDQEFMPWNHLYFFQMFQIKIKPTSRADPTGSSQYSFLPSFWSQAV